MQPALFAPLINDRPVTLIYCAAGNERMAQIAIDAGFRYGAQLPDTVYHAVHFADQDWKNPVKARYILALAQHRPALATVLDWEREEQLPEVLEWAEEVAPLVGEAVIVIPKVFGGIARLPRTIGGRQIRLGYSVPTRHGGTAVPLSEFVGWPVHLLGGQPHKQMSVTKYLTVVSADGNYAQKMATKYCQFWAPGNARYARNRYWPTLREANGGVKWLDDTELEEGEQADAPYEAFARSCDNIMAAWKNITRVSAVE